MFNFLGSYLDYVDSSQDFFNGILFYYLRTIYNM